MYSNRVKSENLKKNITRHKNIYIYINWDSLSHSGETRPTEIPEPFLMNGP